MPFELSPAIVLEMLATAAGLVYIVLLIRENILCWPFAVAGSVLSVILFVGAQLYSEAILYGFYALMGLWGWLRWHRREAAHHNPVILWAVRYHVGALLVGSLCAIGLGYLMQTYTDAERPVFDAFTTCFSFLATYLEIAKVLEAWVYWTLLNVASIWLYQDRDLDIYAVLIGIYAVLSVVGFVSWLKSWRAQPAG